MSEKTSAAASYGAGGTGLGIGLHESNGFEALFNIQNITDILNLVLVVASLILVCYRLYRDLKKPS